MARDFTEKKVAPKVLERDETREYDVNLYKDLCDMGFIVFPMPRNTAVRGWATWNTPWLWKRSPKWTPPGCLFLRCHLSVWRQPVLLRGHR